MELAALKGSWTREKTETFEVKSLFKGAKLIARTTVSGPEELSCLAGEPENLRRSKLLSFALSSAAEVRRASASC